MNNECEHCGEDCEGTYCDDCWDALDSEQESAWQEYDEKWEDDDG